MIGAVLFGGVGGLVLWVVWRLVAGWRLDRRLAAALHRYHRSRQDVVEDFSRVWVGAFLAGLAREDDDSGPVILVQPYFVWIGAGLWIAHLSVVSTSRRTVCGRPTERWLFRGGRWGYLPRGQDAGGGGRVALRGDDRTYALCHACLTRARSAGLPDPTATA